MPQVKQPPRQVQHHPLKKKNEVIKTMLQMKEQSKNLKDQINKEEIDKLHGKQFRVMIVKMIQILEIEWKHGYRKCKKCLTRTWKN